MLPSVLENHPEGKIKKMSDEQFKALYRQTGKILPSNALVVAVSPLNALISDQLESCQRLKLKAVKTSESQQLTLEESSPPEALPRWKRLRPLEDGDDE